MLPTMLISAIIVHIEIIVVINVNKSESRHEQ